MANWLNQNSRLFRATKSLVKWSKAARARNGFPSANGSAWPGWAGPVASAVYAVTRPGDLLAQQFARELGAVWAGDSNQLPPQRLDAAILFAPVGQLVLQALRAVEKGGRVVCGGIHMSEVPPLPYELLWGERT